MPAPVSATNHDSIAGTGARARNRDFKNARFCRARGVPRHTAIGQSSQGLEQDLGGHRTSTGREGPGCRARARAHIDSMRIPLLASVLIATAGAAVAQNMAQLNPGLPPVTSIGSQAPVQPALPPTVPPGGTSAGARYPDTQSLARDRVQSQGYKVQRLEQRNDGSWKAETTRDSVPTRPGGVPTKVTILPDGRILEEWN